VSIGDTSIVIPSTPRRCFAHYASRTLLFRTGIINFHFPQQASQFPSIFRTNDSILFFLLSHSCRQSVVTVRQYISLALFLLHSWFVAGIACIPSFEHGIRPLAHRSSQRILAVLFAVLVVPIISSFAFLAFQGFFGYSSLCRFIDAKGYGCWRLFHPGTVRSSHCRKFTGMLARRKNATCSKLKAHNTRFNNCRI
jgi:hypothetical protein